MVDAMHWEELELPVLRWVLEAGEDQLDLTHGSLTTPLAPALTDDQVHDALSRLRGHRLISGEAHEGSGATWWMKLDMRPDGLRVLGEWPPAEAAALNAALARVLRELGAGLSDEQDATAARRAGSAVSKMSGDVVLDIVKTEARRLGQEAGQ